MFERVIVAMRFRVGFDQSIEDWIGVDRLNGEASQELNPARLHQCQPFGRKHGD